MGSKIRLTLTQTFQINFMITQKPLKEVLHIVSYVCVSPVKLCKIEFAIHEISLISVILKEHTNKQKE